MRQYWIFCVPIFFYKMLEHLWNGNNKRTWKKQIFIIFSVINSIIIVIMVYLAGYAVLLLLYIVDFRYSNYILLYISAFVTSIQSDYKIQLSRRQRIIALQKT